MSEKMHKLQDHPLPDPEQAMKETARDLAGRALATQFWIKVGTRLLEKGQHRPWLALQAMPGDLQALGRINNWARRHILPRADEAEYIARALETSVAVLLGMEQAATPNEEAGELVEFCAKLNQKDKAAFTVVAKAAWEMFRALQRLQQEG